MTIAVVLVHNKTDAENIAQIDALKALIEVNEEMFDEYDSEGNVIGQFTKTYYTLQGLSLDHRAIFLQIIPYGVTEPPNLYDIDSAKVFYRLGDEDKTGKHPRFFNWGLKRGTDYGADICIYLDDYKKFDVSKLLPKIEKLSDKIDTTEFVDDTSCKVATLKMLKDVGQLKEDQTLSNAITDLKARVVEKGYKNG